MPYKVLHCFSSNLQKNVLLISDGLVEHCFNLNRYFTTERTGTFPRYQQPLIINNGLFQQNINDDPFSPSR